MTRPSGRLTIRIIGVFALALALASCGGGGSDTAAAPTTTSSPISPTAAMTSSPISLAADNVVPLQVDAGPDGRQINRAYATVTVCQPGTEVCRTIDHVLIDTGSVGLRIRGADAPAALPQVTDAGGRPLAECITFGSGSLSMWGSIRSADIRIGSRSIASVPIQMLNDEALPNAPCAAGSTDAGTLQDKKALLGIGPHLQDCGAGCAAGPRAAGQAGFYACSTAGCIPAAAPLDRQPRNPVAMLAADNNGHVIVLPQPGAAGNATLAGSLIFGIGTQANNQLGKATVYRTDPAGFINFVYNGQAGSARIDSGDPLIAIPDSSITRCNGFDLFCPAAPITRSVTVLSADRATAGTASFPIVSFGQSNPAASAISIAGFTSTEFHWGLPFFYGRPVFTAMEGASTPAGNGPYVAF